MEEYRKIEGYEVSNLGNCKQNYNKHQNYYRVTDGSDNLIHILVAKAFPEICGDYYDGCVVHHLNHNTTDNRAENLRICGRGEHFNIHREENTLKRKEKYKENEPWFKIAAIKKANGKEHNTNKWCNIAKCDKEDNILDIYENVYYAAEKNNLNPKCIRRCLTGKNKTSGGYKWKKV